MKKNITLFIFSIITIVGNAQSQKAWDKEFERLNVPEDIKEHKLIVVVYFTKKHAEAVEEMMQEYKGKWIVQHYKDADERKGDYAAGLLDNSEGYFLNFKAIGDKAGGKYTKLTSRNFRNVIKHFVHWLNNR